ncbi:MAG: outer membrane lipoprotein-sorting protein [Polyangiaceae bacterium]
MNRLSWLVLALAVFSTLSALSLTAAADSPEQRGLAVAVLCDKANEGFKSEKGELSMQLINAHGDVTNRKLTLEVLEGEGEGDKSRSTFTWPADVKGTRLLTWAHKQGDDDQWLYLPAIKRVKRIASSNKSGSFMGSEFSYEDFGSQEVEKFTYKLLEEPKHEGRDAWLLERYPVDKTSGYTRQVVWMDKEYKQPVRIDYYDRKRELLKTAVFGEFKKYGKQYRSNKIEMSNVQTKKRSVIIWSERRLDVELQANLFRSEGLEN